MCLLPNISVLAIGAVLTVKYDHLQAAPLRVPVHDLAVLLMPLLSQLLVGAAAAGLCRSQLLQQTATPVIAHYPYC